MTQRRLLLTAIVFILLFLLFASQCFAKESRKWKPIHYWMLGGVATISYLDYRTTSKFEENGICELNPSYRQDDCYPDMKKMLIGQIVLVGGVGIIGHYIPKYREHIFIGVMLVQGSAVGMNFSLVY